MNPLDEPSGLKFNSGNTLPPNFKVISIVVLIFGGLMLLLQAFILGVILMLLALFSITQNHIVEVHVDENYIRDYTLHFGFLKLGKKYPLDKYIYVTAMPLIESARAYSRSSHSTTTTDNYHTITMFGNRLRGKRTITKFNTRSEAQEYAKSLADRLNLKYFDYDPKLVREVLLGHRTL